MTKIGLTNKEAEQSRKNNGSNALTEIKRESFWAKLKKNLRDPVIKILCVALAISAIFVFLGKTEWYEAVGIAAAVVIATLVSTFSEHKNEGSFKRLQEGASKIICKVYRNGKVIELPIDDIVVDDCVLLSSGDKIPADGYVYSGFLNVDQSALNGEAREERKCAAKEGYVAEKGRIDFLSEHDVYRGSIVCSGNAVIKVTSVGDATVYGTIASELQQDNDRESPLKVKLSDLAKDISRFGYFGGITMALAYLFQTVIVANGFDCASIMAYCSDYMALFKNIVDAVMLAVVIIVMAAPEGLPLMIALVSSINMGKMLDDNVLVRDINGIETAGSLNILFSDKTGTITKGQLEVVTFVDTALNQYKDLEEIPENIRNSFIANVCLNSQSILSGDGEDLKAISGNATERALLNYVSKSAIYRNQVYEEIPFNSTRKFSAVQPTSENMVYVKGAPEIILKACNYILDTDGTKKELDSNAVNKVIDSLAEEAIRVLAFAECDSEIQDDEILESSGWTLTGLVGIRDEVRAESYASISETQAAGVQVVMITGDRRETAMAIAKEAGLIQSSTDLVITSSELREMSDGEIAKKLKRIRVVARALPSDKSRLVNVAQSMNLVVGMTGDGVNDSPALKKADIGFAMGSGTEVAKEAAGIVILDDNFNSIKMAILYGRTIFNSIRKFIIYQLSISVSAVLVSFVMPLVGITNPLTIVQILWINLIIDIFAALAFGGEPALLRYMKEKPKRRDEKIITNFMWSAIITGSLWIFMLSLVFLLSPQVKEIFRVGDHNEYLMTGYFCFFVFVSVFNAFNARTEKIKLFDNIHRNKSFLIIMIFIIVSQVIMTYFGNAVFRCYGLTPQEWMVIIVLSITIIPVGIMRKVCWNFAHKGRKKKQGKAVYSGK